MLQSYIKIKIHPKLGRTAVFPPGYSPKTGDNISQHTHIFRYYHTEKDLALMNPSRITVRGKECIGCIVYCSGFQPFFALYSTLSSCLENFTYLSLQRYFSKAKLYD
jgi:hypothetical protein